MRILTTAALAAATLMFSAFAHADTVNFVSSTSATTYGPSNSATFAYTNAAYGAPVVVNGVSSAFVSTSSDGGGGAVGTFSYYTNFTLLSDETYSGSVKFLADNYASVFINGHSIYTGSDVGSSAYSTGITVAINSFLMAGVNTIRFDVTNTAGVSALDFGGSVTGVPDAAPTVTPEPSSLMLLGTGILGVAGAARRRFLNA